MATKKTNKRALGAVPAKRAGARRAAAPSERKTTPAAAAQAAPAVVPAPAIEIPAKPKSFWLQLVFVLIVLAVGIEVVVMLKGKIDRQGELKLIRVIGTRGGPPEVAGQFWGPSNIRIDRTQNRLAMVDGQFAKVIFYSTQDGSLLAEVDKKGKHQVIPNSTAAQTDDFQPVDGAFDGQGNFYVLDQKHAEVTVISPDYKIKGTWKVSSPQNIAVDAKQNRIYIEDKSMNNIVVYTPEGKEVERFGGDDLQEPSFLAVDDNGDIYVVDKGAKKILVFGADEKLKRAWSLKFNPFGNPDIDVSRGKVYVCEHDNQRVWVFDVNGKFLWDLVASYPAVMGVDGAGMVYLSGAEGIHQCRVIKHKHD